MQGVGFRPFVYKLALLYNIKGNVNNTNNGVHIFLNGDSNSAHFFLQQILENAPSMSVITKHSVERIADQKYDNFNIIHSNSEGKPDLLLAPDFSFCEDCKAELHHSSDHRFKYPFITCTNCGPRFSIITELPYDRENTSMDKFTMCPECQLEYNNPLDRRYYSQTNSCKKCGISMSVYENNEYINGINIIEYVVDAWNQGKIVAIKGIGGFLITCDASNSKTITSLRERKHRPSKPFALMYTDVNTLSQDVEISEKENIELKSIWSPIVLLKLKKQIITPVDLDGICSGLDRIGVMLPYSPLFELLMQAFGKPVVATSGNISGSTIIFENEKAIAELTGICDLIVLNDRDIVVPQDDSVVKYSNISDERIVIRRSRGIAPSHIDPSLKLGNKSILATGALLKSTFSIVNNGQIYISQFLGNTDVYDSQLNFIHTLDHFTNLLSFLPKLILIDKHPGYFSHVYGIELASKYDVPVFRIQHHKAHFAAVLAENNLLDIQEKVLGVIFDGTGYGDDGNIWGGEFFVFESSKMTRYHHLDYFDHIAGDKMALEPRISALSVSKDIEDSEKYLRPKFSGTEWKVYSRLLDEQAKMKCSSIGRLFDAASSLILGIDKQSYEGEAAMKLESLAESYFRYSDLLPESYVNNNDESSGFIKQIIAGIFKDLDGNEELSGIAARFHVSLVDYIKHIASASSISKIAFSGGVFQNSLLTDLIIKSMSEKFSLYFHKKISPNDECISFGQTVYYSYGIDKK